MDASVHKIWTVLRCLVWVRQLVEYLRTSYRVSIRRACGVVRCDRSTYHYKHSDPEQASLRQRIRELSEARVR
jgi:putative transposase